MTRFSAFALALALAGAAAPALAQEFLRGVVGGAHEGVDGNQA